MVVKSGLLLEGLGASWLAASIRLFLRVDVHVLLQVLVLCKVLPTDFAHKALEAQVRNYEMPAEALLGGKLFAAALEGAALLDLSFGSLDHLFKVLRD
jgi:hypothetical protein